MLLHYLALLPSTLPLTLSIPATLTFLLFFKHTSTSRLLHLQFLYLESFSPRYPLPLSYFLQVSAEVSPKTLFSKDQSKTAGTTLIPQSILSPLSYFISCRELNATWHVGLPCLNRHSISAGTFLSLVIAASPYLVWSLPHSRCSIKSCWMNEWAPLYRQGTEAQKDKVLTPSSNYAQHSTAWMESQVLCAPNALLAHDRQEMALLQVAKSWEMPAKRETDGMCAGTPHVLRPPELA